MDPPSLVCVRPPSKYDRIPGYETMLAEGEGGVHHPPVLSDQQSHPETRPSCPSWDIASLSKHDAQQAFIKYASSKRCYSTRPAEEGVITNMEAFDTYRYRLVTFTETRTTEWSQRPYYGQVMDTSGQAPPRPWEIPVDVPAFFVVGNQIIENCIRCSATGRTTCTACGGVGVTVCSACYGTGYVSYSANRQRCIVCGGNGRKTCWECNRLGWNQCDVCSGHLKVVVSISLVVTWLNDIEEHVVEQSSGLEMFKLFNVPGKELLADSNYMVYPISDFPDPTVVQTSERLLREHQDKYLHKSRILQQCQTIELLPITKVTYRWKGDSHVFFVYGRDLNVSAEDYPAACCCCGCSVM